MSKENEIKRISEMIKDIENKYYYKNILHLTCLLYDLDHAEVIDIINKIKERMKGEDILYVRNIINKFFFFGNDKEYIHLGDLIIFACCYEIGFEWSKSLGILNLSFKTVTPDIKLNDIKVRKFEIEDLMVFRISKKSKGISYEKITAIMFKLYRFFFYDTSYSTVKYIKEAPIHYKVGHPIVSNDLLNDDFKMKEDLILIKTIDVDAVVGIVPPEDIGSNFYGNFELDFILEKEDDNSYRPSLSSKDFLFLHRNEVIEISECRNFFLGCFKLSLGDLNVFFVYPNKGEKKVKFDKIYEALYNLKHYENKKDIDRIRCSN